MESLTSEQVDVLSGETSFRGALAKWIVEYGAAVPWNVWQRGFAVLRPKYVGGAEAMPPLSMPSATWCQSLWCELSEGAYGSEWRKTLRGGRGPFSLPQSGRPRGVQLGTASGPTTLVRLGTSAAVEGRGSPRCGFVARPVSGAVASRQ